MQATRMRTRRGNHMLERRPTPYLNPGVDRRMADSATRA